MDEVDIEPVDLGNEVRQRVQLRFAPPPIIIRLPVAGELRHERQLHALLAVIDQLPFRPSDGPNAPLQVREIVVRSMETERPNGRIASRLAKNERVGLALR